MNYLLDTCVLSEFTRHKPDEKVVRWMDAMDEEEMFISVITLGEIQRGIEKLPDSHHKTALLTWMNEDLIARFGNRVITIDVPSMLVWGTLTSRMDASGTPMGVMDSLLAASALSRNMVLVTRNVKDFTGSNLSLVNPWE